MIFTCGQQFYVDKTHFITEWLREGTKITLITRPRRFGKTTLLSTVRMFLIQDMLIIRNISISCGYGRTKEAEVCSEALR
ncbi:AAA family ATPase [Roseburia inulinivorans]|uniref:AAA family ATPase n=1 Tax=Roseburia inulinivorans TaxID=360807 RepID=UPI0002E2FAB4|nr:AAA family ATPase [Roseburia inulinivorans]